MRYDDLFEDNPITLNIQWVPTKLDQWKIEHGESAVVWVDVAKFDKAWAHDCCYLKRGGKDGEDGRVTGRYERFGEWLKQGLPVEMPIASLGADYKREISVVFGNGRHRFSWMRDHGAKAVPIVAFIDDAEDMKRLYGANIQKTLIRESSRLDELRNLKNDRYVGLFKDMMTDPTQIRNNLSMFANVLKGKGFTKLGSGSYGLVLTRPDLNYAIKIFKNDRSYQRFVAYCLDHPNNPHLPKFRGKIMTVDNVHFAVRMELLKPLPYHLMLSAIEEYADRRRGMSRDEYLGGLNNKSSVFQQTVDLAKTQPDLLDTIDALRDLAGPSVGMDLHHENIMQRADGTLVITDPFFGR